MTLEEYWKKYHISNDVPDVLFQSISNVHFNAGDTIIQMGERSDCMYLILQGIVRGFYLDADGNDVTKCFSKEADWCGYYNFLHQGPSPFYIEALEDCDMIRLPIHVLQNLMDHHIEIRQIYDRLSKEAFLQSEEKISTFQRMDAKERYLCYFEKHPDICNRVKQEYLASFLGITPSSLSRIKRML